jgi:hypothetical protein
LAEEIAALARTLVLFRRLYSQLNSVTKSFLPSILLPDIIIILLFLPADMYHLFSGHGIQA